MPSVNSVKYTNGYCCISFRSSIRQLLAIPHDNLVSLCNSNIKPSFIVMLREAIRKVAGIKHNLKRNCQREFSNLRKSVIYVTVENTNHTVYLSYFRCIRRVDATHYRIARNPYVECWKICKRFGYHAF